MRMLATDVVGVVNRSGIVADSVNDISSTRKVYLLAGGLAVLGVLLVIITVWFWRSTRHDPEVLAPLEAMGTRRFRRLDGHARQQLLDAQRPAGAEPSHVARTTLGAQPEIDLRAQARSGRSGFDDLRDPELGADVPVDAAGVESSVDALATPAPDAPADGAAVAAELAPPTLESAEPVEADAPAVEPALEPAVEAPLVIVALDHDMPRPFAPPTFPPPAPPAPEEVEMDVTASDERPSIDPLLRNRDTADN